MSVQRGFRCNFRSESLRNVSHSRNKTEEPFKATYVSLVIIKMTFAGDVYSSSLCFITHSITFVFQLHLLSLSLLAVTVR